MPNTFCRHSPALLGCLVVMALGVLSDARAVGQLDPEFAGGAGFTTFELSTGEQPNDYAFSVLVDSSDRILLTGYRSTGLSGAVQRDAVVMRLLDDGSPDPAFGTNGVRIIDFNLGGALEAGLAVFETGDGGYLVCGGAQDADGGPIGYARFAIARLLTDGSLDTAFDGDGMFDFALLPDGLEQNQPAGCALAPDGSVVVFGSAVIDGEVFGQIVLGRVLPDASLDPDFGEAGIAVVPLPAGELTNPKPGGVHIDTQGRIVIAGYVTNLLPRKGATTDMLAVRLLPNGALDPDFGNEGIRTVAFDAGGGDYDIAHGLAPHGGGSMLLVGLASTEANGTEIAVARLTAAGAVDPTFGENGRMLHGRDPGTGVNETGIRVTVDALKRIYIAGRATTGPQDEDAAVLRLLPTGVIDTGFGVDGWSVFGLEPPPDPSLDTAAAITLDRRNRVVAAGALLVSLTSDDLDVMVARLTSDLLHYDRFEAGN